MSKTFRDGRGGRINGEIWGHTDMVIGGDDKIYAECGGSEVGSPGRKRDAKKAVARMRRIRDKRLIISAMNEL